MNRRSRTTSFLINNPACYNKYYYAFTAIICSSMYVSFSSNSHSQCVFPSSFDIVVSYTMVAGPLYHLRRLSFTLNIKKSTPCTNFFKKAESKETYIFRPGNMLNPKSSATSSSNGKCTFPPFVRAVLQL